LIDTSKLTFDANGLIPAIIQSAKNNQVLMIAYMNLESLKLTQEKGETVFFSRSRNELWHKGATSGNTQKVLSIKTDCDSDSLLISVLEMGPACHTGTHSCFDNHIEDEEA
jgi:phosphoribosyl-AMP cyclohydrolase